MSSVFDDLVGQQHITGVLQAAVAASRTGKESQEMTHAWVFTGPPGSGRSSAAVAFAQALICKNDSCGTCSDCSAAKTSGHPDVEIIRTEGLSIKIGEIRELLTRVAWAPSLANRRVVVLEDADRLTESAANALLKAIEEPGTRTVWLLCAPTLHDVLPTIRSRCRHLQLRTPSTVEVTQVLISLDKISPNMAHFAAKVSQGHIGRARFLSISEMARSNRKTIMQLPMKLGSLASAFEAAQTLVDIATHEAIKVSETRDTPEIEKLKEAYGKSAEGRGMATGGAKAVKELEQEQRARTTRMVLDSIDSAIIDITTFYRDVLMAQIGDIETVINSGMREQVESYAAAHPIHSTISKINALMDARTNLAYNAAPLVTCEALMCQLALK